MEHPLSELPEAWQLAIRREKESVDFYRRMEQSTGSADLKALFRSLAEQEVLHRERLESEYRRLFEADMEEGRGRTGTFEHIVQAETPPLITWHPWGDDAFRLAHELDVPVLLSISAVWCHWCHVMDRTTFADPEVAQLIDNGFVAVRVDNDKRPDINARYNMGGWPSVVFLTPEGEILTGGTYMTVSTFKDLLQRVRQYYREHKPAIAQRISENQAQRNAGVERSSAKPVDLGLQISDEVLRAVVNQYDPEFGGFGQAPKFPQVDAIELAMAKYHLTSDVKVLEIAVNSLKAMCQGGLFDSEMGGFFRYSTTRDWSVPHYEKMLEDNARLLSACMHAYQLTRHMLFHDCALGVVDYVNSTLYDTDRGYFYGSQDADEKYYRLNRKERQQGNAPFVDKIAYTSWNAMMVSAYLDAWLLLERPDLADRALGALRFLWKQCWRPDRGMFHFWDGEAQIPGLLADQVWMANALLDAYEYSGNWEYVDQSQQIMTWTHSSLLTASGAYADRPPGPAQGLLKLVDTPIVENAVAAAALVRLSRLTGSAEYRQWAESALQVFVESYPRYGLAAAAYALAVDRVHGDCLRVVVVGGADDTQALQLLRAARQPYAADRLLTLVDPVWEPDRLASLGYPAQPTPAAYACQGQTCAKPASDTSQLVERIHELFSRCRA